MAHHPNASREPTSSSSASSSSHHRHHKPHQTSKSIAFATPARFARSFDEGEDVTAPKSRKTRYMNQSFIGLIASAGISSTLNPGYEDGVANANSQLDSPPPNPTARESVRDSLVSTRTRPGSDLSSRSDQRMLQSSPNLHRPPRRRRHIEQDDDDDPMLTSQILSRPEPIESPSKLSSSPDNHLSHVPESEPPRRHSPYDQREPPVVPPLTGEESRVGVNAGVDAAVPAAESETTLSERLAVMFGLDEPEEVMAEYPCCLLKDITQPGYMYLLEKHICFYAYLPRRSNKIAKSGYLFKRGRQNPKYNRYWFVLKGDALSYYKDRSNLYFPRDTIDLRSGVTCTLADDANEDGASFSITTQQSMYQFKADSATTANEWIEEIHKVTFRPHHTGDSVKICLPLQNILDIEEKEVMSNQFMLGIKVVANDETFAVDEHFFSLTDCDPQAVSRLRRTVDSSNAALSRPHSGSEPTGMENVNLGGPSSNPADGLAPIDRANDPNLQRGGNLFASSSHDLEHSEKLQGQSMTDSQSLRPSWHLRQNTSYSSITSIYQAGAERWRQASSIAGVIRSQSKRVGSRLAHGSYEYYDKVATMWAGKKTHYDDDEKPLYRKGTDQESVDGDNFRRHFGLASSEKLKASFYCYMQRTILVYGKMYVGTTKLCFRNLAGPRTKLILPYRDIENVAPENGFHLGYSGLVVVVRGHEEIFFEFSKPVGRDDCAVTLVTRVEEVKSMQDSRILPTEEKEDLEAARAEHALLEKARSARRASKISNAESEMEAEDDDQGTLFFDDTFASILDFTPSKMNITCLTVGSRGDVQPYIALCLGLLKEGHSVTIATHAEFEPWIRSHGINYRYLAGDPTAIMKLCVENDMATPGFVREGLKLRKMLKEIYESSWTACQGTDLLIESPSTMSGIHVAEALEIPYFRAFTMPWTRTRAFPHAFAVLSQRLGGNWNYYSYGLIEYGLWAMTSDLINSFRTKTLGLRKTTLKEMRYEEVPFLYNYSPSVVSPPLDFGPNIHITGYWFLDEGKDYKPPAALVDFIARARKDGKRLVYIGFGSITLEDPAGLTRAISEAVLDADVRCILCKGWSDRSVEQKQDPSVPEIPLHESIFQIRAAPHDWLFRQVDVAVHHGGAGTTGASLRAGIPTLVKPFFGDQHFFATRVEDLGVGLALNNINSKSLAQALRGLTRDERIIQRARALGEKIRSENGVRTAIQTIYRDLDYARSLIRRRWMGDEDAEKDLPPEPPAPLLEDAMPIRTRSRKASEDSWTLLSDAESASTQRGRSILSFEATLPRGTARGGSGDDAEEDDFESEATSASLE